MTWLDDWSDDGSSKRKTFELDGNRVEVSLENRGDSASLMKSIDARLSPGGSINVEVTKLHETMLSILKENHALRENLKSVQERCTVLITTARAWRKKLIELGQSDPGLP